MSRTNSAKYFNFLEFSIRLKTSTTDQCKHSILMNRKNTGERESMFFLYQETNLFLEKELFHAPFNSKILRNFLFSILRYVEKSHTGNTYAIKYLMMVRGGNIGYVVQHEFKLHL